MIYSLPGLLLSFGNDRLGGGGGWAPRTTCAFYSVKLCRYRRVLYCAYLLLNNSPVVLINYYAPDQEVEQIKVLDRFTHILDQLDITEDTTFIWGGDFNMIFDIDQDADGGSLKLYIKSALKLLSVMFEIDLCDIYRARNPDSRRGEHGEKSSRYLLNLEKRNKAKSHVRTLISESVYQVSFKTLIGNV